jgi:cell shape-determining protein MreC
MIKKFTKEIEMLKAANESFQHSLQFYSDSFDEFRVILEEAASLATRVEALKTENASLKRLLPH